MAAAATRLFLHEELLLIALNDEKGTVHARAGMYHYASSAAILTELLLAERITVEHSDKKFVEVASHKPVGDEIIDECLERIVTSTRRQRLQTWVSRLAGTKRLRHRIAESLCRKGILHEDEDKVLWIFTRKLYPERDSRYERKMIDRMRKAIFQTPKKIDPRTAMLISLTHGASMLPIIFDKRDLRDRKAHIKKICDGEMMGKAASDAIAAAQAAVMAACIASTVVTTTAACS